MNETTVLIGKDSEGNPTILQNWVRAAFTGQLTEINVDGYTFTGFSLHAALKKARRAGKISFRHCSKKSPCFECRVYEYRPGLLCPAAKKHWNRMHPGREYLGDDRILLRKRGKKGGK